MLVPLGLLAVTLGSTAPQAAPVGPVEPRIVAGAATIAPGVATPVQYRRGGGGRGWGFRGWGPAVGLGIVGGAIIANEIYRPRRGYYYDTYAYNGPYYYPTGYSGDPRRICAQHFKSFEWETGYYTTYGGDHRVCPYLK